MLMAPAVSSYNDVERVHVASNNAIGATPINKRATSNGDVMAVYDRLLSARYNNEFVLNAMLLAGDVDQWLPSSFASFCRGNMRSAKSNERAAATALLGAAIEFPTALRRLREKLRVAGDIAPLTFDQLLRSSEDEQLTHVSTHLTVLAAVPLTISTAMPILHPIPRSSLVDVDSSMLGKRRRAMHDVDDSYLTPAELESLKSRQPAVMITRPDGAKMRLVEAVVEPDLFLPSRVLDVHHSQHGVTLSTDAEQRLCSLTLLDAGIIHSELEHRHTVAQTRHLAADKRRATCRRKKSSK